MAAANQVFPGIIGTPEYAGNVYDIQTKQALAQALLQKGLQGNLAAYQPAGGGFGYVPRMGIGGALAGSVLPSVLGAALQRQANQELTALGQQQQAALTRMLTPQTVTETIGGGAPGMVPAGVAGQPGVAGQSDAQALGAALAPQTVTRTTAAPLNPGNLDPNVARYLLNTAPEKYLENVLSYYKPADIVAEIRAAGIDPNSAIGQQMAQARIAQKNFIAPTISSPGQTVTSNMGGGTRTNPFIQGGQEVLGYTLEGRPIVASMIGAEGSAQGLARATAMGKAGAEPIAGVDAAGNPVFTTKAAVAQGQGAGQAPQPTAGRFSGYQAPGGGGVRPGLSPAEQEGQIGLAKSNVGNYSTLKDTASNSAERTNILDSLEAYANGRTTFGPGWTGRIENLAAINSKLPSGLAFGSNDVSNAQVVQKLASNLIQQYQKSMGGTGTDKQFELVMHGTPGADMTNKAMLEVIPKLKSMELALQAKAGAADNWLAANNNNPASLNKFETDWRRNYDPRIFQAMMMDPQQRQVFLSQQKDAAQLRAKTQALGALLPPDQVRAMLGQ